MFEKSLYDLIRGLRNHKGNEREYIHESIRECRQEIRSNDMDLKATALLKLTYLEMFGHDMSWASFNVLEVMSSAKHVHKRVGYLAAVQSFRADTEVLLLAENLLKKDLTSTQATIIMLPLLTIPHVANPTMANSLLSDLLPRLNHSNPAIRKKTVVTLYRLALVYPETLRPSWPRITERLQDESEDPSVTAALVNVVCELGWRRPRDFLPLAPRLFDLLVNQGDNWVAIKIIKLFATLTPLEPRLIKKLLPPLISIIKATPAMSLLYECINGIIQGGILASVEGTTEGEEVARLCIGKLRGMLAVAGDPNLKFVALLAFQRLVDSHADLVYLHQDVILECIDDPDISIRMRALDLVVGMIDADNLVEIVSRLMTQLESSPLPTTLTDPNASGQDFVAIEARADSDDEGAQEEIRPGANPKSDAGIDLPVAYRVSIMKQIISMCSKDTYSNVSDFEWYIEILIKLVRLCPPIRISGEPNVPVYDTLDASQGSDDISLLIGKELLNVAVRVKSLRAFTVSAAQSLLLIDSKTVLFPKVGNGGLGVLACTSWLVGEFAEYLTNPEGILISMLDPSSLSFPPFILAKYIQAIPKIFSTIAGASSSHWTPHRRTTTVLLLARIIHFFESLSSHPNLDIQERAVEFLELFKLVSEAASSQDVQVSVDTECEPPLLLTRALPSLFSGQELNPVAHVAQAKVPLPDDFNMDNPINQDLQNLLHEAGVQVTSDVIDQDINVFYNIRTENPGTNATSAREPYDTVVPGTAVTSYQQGSAADFLDAELAARRKIQRQERNRDDPFYIGAQNQGSNSISRGPSPLGQLIRGSNGETLDIDSIPIMDLDLDVSDAEGVKNTKGISRSGISKTRKKTEILAEETIDDDLLHAPGSHPRFPTELKPEKASGSRTRNPLQVDSSNLGTFDLGNGESTRRLNEYEARQTEEKMLKEVERLQLELQRASERVEMRDNAGPDEGVVVRKKKKKKVKVVRSDQGLSGAVLTMPTVVADGVETSVEGNPTRSSKTLRKKKKKKQGPSDNQSSEHPQLTVVSEEAKGLPEKSAL